MTAIHAVIPRQCHQRHDAAGIGRRRRGQPIRHSICKSKGANVITTVSSPEKAKAAREAGADHTIDYKRENVGDRVMEITGNRGVDAVIEMDLTANAKLIPACCGQRAVSSSMAPGLRRAAGGFLPGQFDPPAIFSGLRA